MLGKPKYKLDDKVKFTCIKENGEKVELCGTIYIIDKYGTFEQSEDVSYDVMVENDPNYECGCLYKHIRESSLTLL